jgi:hypothetical protein
MGKVMITCPTTGRQAFTGIETDAGSVNLIPPINTRLKCPQCGRTHVWSMLDAELVVGESERRDADEIPVEWKSRVASIRDRH